MFHTHHIQCLLFAVHEGRIPDLRKSGVFLDGSKVKGYALLPGAESQNDLRAIFDMSGIRLLSKKEDCPPELIEAVKSDRVEMMEVIVDECAVNVSNNSLHIAVEPFNLLTTIPLFTGLVSSESQHDLSFFNACSALGTENLDIIAHLLNHRADIRHSHANGGTLLHFAVKRRHEPLVQLLLKKGAELEARMLDGATPLHVAVDADYLPIFNLLLKQGANVNATKTSSEHEGVTPLHLALYRRRSNMVQPLLDKGALVNADSRLGNILHLAVKAETESLAHVLSRRPDLKSTSNQAAFRSALKDICGKKEKVKLLLDYGFQLVPEDAKDAELFYGVISIGCCEIVKQLFEWGASVHQLRKWDTNDGTTVTPLHVAVYNGEEAMVQLLLDHGADINGKGNNGCTPLRHAVDYGNIKVAKFLLANGARVQDDPKLLHVAAEVAGESTEIVEILLQNGADINAANDEGQTPLIVAASNGRAEVVQVLCRYGAIIDSDDDATLKEFLKNIAAGNTDVVKVFIQNGFEVENKMADLLICAIKSGYEGIVEFLLELEDRPGTATFNNFNILFVAGKSKNLRALEAVLEYAYLNLDLIAASGIFGGFTIYGDEEWLDSSDSSDSSGSQSGVSTEQIRKVAGDHAVKIKAANLRENQDEQIFRLPLWPWKSSFPKDCETEVAALKAERIGDLNLTFYDVLDATVPEIVSFTRNQSCVRVLKTNEYADRFPIYGSIIFRRFHKGYYRRKLLERGIKMFDFLFKGSELPYELKERIVNYLSNQNLLVFNNVCDLPDEESSAAPDAL